MKIIHCADIHLGSKIDSKFSKEVSESRKQEVRNSFKRMVDYARAEKIEVILLAGDVFDSDKPFKKDKDFFFSVIENNPQIDFLYLRGNHDAEGERRTLANLKTFSSDWTSYDYEYVTVSGVELTRENCAAIYSTLSLNPVRKNVVMLHGQIGDSLGKDKINLGKLREKSIDYLALGHIHEYSSGKLDDRGTYAYCGCLEGRGFDETGEKGFIVVDVSERITHAFVPFSECKIVKVQLDVTGLSDAYAVSLRAREIKFERKNIYRLELIGEVDAHIDSLADDVKKYLASECEFLDVKDRTRKRIDVSAYAGDASLKGEFVRAVCASGEFTDEEKAQIVAYGLKALGGREVEA